MQMLRIARILYKKKDTSPDELSVVPRFEVGCLSFNSLHGSSQGSEQFDRFNRVFYMWAMERRIYSITHLTDVQRFWNFQ